MHVATLVREIVNGLQHMAGMERIAFQWELDEGIVVRTDPERLKVGSHQPDQQRGKV